MLKILIVDHSQLICDAISTVIDREINMKVIGQATTNEEVLAQIEKCDVILIHTQLSSMDNSGSNGKGDASEPIRDVNIIQLLRRISQDYPEIQALVLGLPQAVPVILHYLEAGACGYVQREDSTSTLLQKIRAAHAGRPIISPEVTAALVSRVSELKGSKTTVPPHRDSDELIERLTKREQEVLRLVEQKLSNREIANRLYIEVGTVKNHVHSVLKKLDVESREEAALFAPLLAPRSGGADAVVATVKNPARP